MVPIIDDYIQAFLVKKLRFLKENSSIISQIFQSQNPTTINNLIDLIENQQIRVVIGFPREQTLLPAYVITLAPEQEQPTGLGDNLHTYGKIDFSDDIGEIAQIYVDDFISSTSMNATYRIECWSDNGDLTAYMYCILKWCLWSSRKEMIEIGWNNIRIEGTDLEPVPDYMPVFIYRRSAQLILTYDNLYYEDLSQLSMYLDVLNHPENYFRDSEGNILNANEDIIIPAKHKFVINANVYSRLNFKNRNVDNPTVNFLSQTLEIPSMLKVIHMFPEIGDKDTLYMCRAAAGEFKSYAWNPFSKTFENTPDDVSTFKNIVIVDSRGGT